MTGRGEDWLTRSGWSAEELQALGVDFGVCALAVETMTACCRDAWTTGLLRGFNGNMSLRMPAAQEGGVLLVTGTGVAKGHMLPGSLALSDLDGHLLLGAPLSSETAMHTAVYRRRPEVGCVLHVHPAAMLALSLRLQGRRDNFLSLPLFESAMWRSCLGWAPAVEPGTSELAEAVGAAFALAGIRAVFMEGHGLCAAGRDAWEALGVCEQFEHMASAQLMSLA